MTNTALTLRQRRLSLVIKEAMLRAAELAPTEPSVDTRDSFDRYPADTQAAMLRAHRIGALETARAVLLVDTDQLARELDAIMDLNSGA